jgi:hypothetical protein
MELSVVGSEELEEEKITKVISIIPNLGGDFIYFFLHQRCFVFGA